MVFTKRKAIFAVVILVLLIISFFITYYLVYSSDPYKLSVNFIYKSQEVNDKIGKVSSITLGFFGYSVSYSGPSGKAEFKIDLKGEKGNGTAFIEVKKKAGIWKITEATLKLENGETMKLDTRTSNLQQ